MPSLDELAEHPGRAQTLSPELVAALLARCSALQSALTARLVAVPPRPSTAIEPTDRLLPMPAVAELLAIPTSYAYELARQGRLPAVRLGKYVRVRVSDIEAWLLAHGQDPLDPSRLASGTVRHRPRGRRAHPTRQGPGSRRSPKSTGSSRADLGGHAVREDG
jgi:excisionase family DNA binding protein